MLGLKLTYAAKIVSSFSTKFSHHRSILLVDVVKGSLTGCTRFLQIKSPKSRVVAQYALSLAPVLLLEYQELPLPSLLINYIS